MISIEQQKWDTQLHVEHHLHGHNKCEVNSKDGKNQNWRDMSKFNNMNGSMYQGSLSIFNSEDKQSLIGSEGELQPLLVEKLEENVG